MNFKKIGIGALLLAAALLYAYFASTISNERQDTNTSGVAFYNEAIELSKAEQIDAALEKYQQALTVAPLNSRLSVYAAYNYVTLWATYKWNSDEADDMLALLNEALRQDDSDLDIRKNIEILNARLVQELIDRGNSLETIEKALDPNSELWPSDKQGEGEEDSPFLPSDDSF